MVRDVPVQVTVQELQALGAPTLLRSVGGSIATCEVDVAAHVSTEHRLFQVIVIVNFHGHGRAEITYESFKHHTLLAGVRPCFRVFT